jgi:hypothetical protein
MEHRIEIEEYEAQKIIHTYITGTMSEEERNRIAVETARKMRDNNITKAIWDIREAVLGYSLVGSHQVVMNLPALGITKDDYVAVIYFHNKEQHQHASTVAHNRGIYNLGYFQNIEEGINWLTGKG